MTPGKLDELERLEAATRLVDRNVARYEGRIEAFDALLAYDGDGDDLRDKISDLRSRAIACLAVERERPR